MRRAGGVPVGHGLELARERAVHVVAAHAEHDAAARAHEKWLAFPLGAHADDRAVLDDELTHGCVDVGRDRAVHHRGLDEPGHHAGPEAAKILGEALADQLVVPARDVREPAPGVELAVQHAGRHVRRHRIGLRLPLAELGAAEQLHREIAPARVRAGRVGVVVVGQALDRGPAHAGLAFEVLDRGVHRVEQLALVLGSGEARRQELEVTAAGVVRIRDAELAHLVAVGDEDLPAAVAADAPEPAGLLEHDHPAAAIVGRDRGADRAETRPHRDDVDLEIPARRSLGHA